MAMTLLVAAGIGLFVGVVVGGLGGGGGVLTLPALVYALGQSAQDATTGSVIIVGLTAVTGVAVRWRGGGIDRSTGLGFAAVGVPAAWLGTLLNRHASQPLLLLAFAGLTVLAAATLLLDSHGGDGVADTSESDPEPRDDAGGSATAVQVRTRLHGRVVTVAKIVVCGALIGFLTGFLGVGGGFLVVPALVVVLRMPMSRAVGTSLLIIMINSIVAVVSRFGAMHLDWRVIAPFTLAAVIGTLAGKRVADRLSGAVLTRAFAVMLVAVGVFVAVESIAAI